MKQYLQEILVFVASIAIYSLILLAQNEIIITVLFLLVVLAGFRIVYYNKEWRVFVLGVLVGFVLEASGDLIYKMQFWETGLIFGTPSWLYILWGFLFVHMRRMGNIVIGRK